MPYRREDIGDLLFCCESERLVQQRPEGERVADLKQPAHKGLHIGRAKFLQSIIENLFLKREAN
jgi:hypothetical protein